MTCMGRNQCVIAVGLALWAAGVLAMPALAAPNGACFGERATIAGSGPLTGTAGDNVIVGFDAADSIDGLGGEDLICGLGGSDQLSGGLGDDRVDGGSGDDFIRGDVFNPVG
jgi:Ca2+-binding RTX toxin-like protein